MKSKMLGLLALYLLVGPAAALASPSPTDISSFSNAVLDLNVADDAPLTNQYAAQGVTFGGAFGNSDFAALLPGAGALVGTNFNDAGCCTVISFDLSRPTRVFGGVFSTSDNTTFTFTVFDGATNLGSLDFAGTFNGQFRGLFNAVAFNRVTLANPASGFSFDLLRFAAVPEPGTLALLGLGLTGLALSRKLKAA